MTPGDAAQTANDIMASPTTFRLGVASLYLVIVLDIVAAWALFRFFTPVSTSISRLTAWLRLAYSGVFLVAISQLAGIPALLTDPAHEAAFGRQQLQAQAMLKVEAFNDIWMAALLLFGAHLIGLGYLAYRSGYAPSLPRGQGRDRCVNATEPDLQQVEHATHRLDPRGPSVDLFRRPRGAVSFHGTRIRAVSALTFHHAKVNFHSTDEGRA